MNRFATILVGYVAISGLIVSVTSAQKQSKEITREQGRRLVLAVLESQGFDPKSPDLVVEDQPDDPDMPGFYMIGSYTKTGCSAGAYAVGRRSVEVWNWMHCSRFSRAKKVKELQRQLRKEIGLTKDELRELSAKRPFCFSTDTTDK